jgi:hypothetical protein
MWLFVKHHKKLIVIISSLICLLIIFIALLKITLGFSGMPITGKVVFSDECEWIKIQIPDYNGYYYNVTDIGAFTNNIDKHIGRINYNGTSIIPATIYDVYSLKNHPNQDIIALKTKYGYLLAVRGEKEPGGNGPVIVKSAK